MSWLPWVQHKRELKEMSSSQALSEVIMMCICASTCRHHHFIYFPHLIIIDSSGPVHSLSCLLTSLHLTGLQVLMCMSIWCLSIPCAQVLVFSPTVSCTLLSDRFLGVWVTNSMDIFYSVSSLEGTLNWEFLW